MSIENNAESATDLAIRIEAAVRAVSGVSAVYSALPTVSRTVRELASGTAAVPLVAITQTADSLAVTVNVGVGVGDGDGTGQAPVTAAAVAAAVRRALETSEIGADLLQLRDADVTVRVSRIHD